MKQRSPSCRKAIPGKGRSPRSSAGPRLVKKLVGGCLACNGLIAAVCLALLLTAETSRAQENTEADGGKNAQQAGRQPETGTGAPAVGAGLAAGLAAVGAGVGVGLTGAAAIGAITEKPGMLGRTLIFVGLAEGIAIYGLIVAFMILTGALGG